MKNVRIDIAKRKFSVWSWRNSNWETISFEEAGLKENTFETDDYIEDRDEIEEILADRYEDEEFEIEYVGAENELRNVIENGYIMHVVETGEDFLTDGEDFFCYLGKGNISDWENDKDVEKGVFDYPSDFDTIEQSECYRQKNQDTNNPARFDDFRYLENENFYEPHYTY